MDLGKKNALTIFLKKLTIKFIAVGLLCAAVFHFWLPQHYFHFLPGVILYFYILNFFVYYFLIKSFDLSTVKFSQYFLLITTLKFFGSLIFAVTYMIFAKESLIAFLVIFIILYFSSLIQVVSEFLRFLKEKK
jgi:hypothetical protein